MSNKYAAKHGVLYWITGLYGSGKTTIGNHLYYQFKEHQDNVVLLDGDILKSTLGGDVKNSYSLLDRKTRAITYANICKLLTDQGLVVICCTISMFDEIREWNRKNNKAYVEVFLDVPEKVLKERDEMGIYNNSSEDYLLEFPKNPDISIVNDGSITVADCVKKIMDYNVCYRSDYDRDVGYWNLFYASHPDIEEPSFFAQFVVGHLQKGKSLIELGCGNGRDSVFFYENGISVTAIDASNQAIADLQKKHNDEKNIYFICDDFVCSSSLYAGKYDYCYSRFTLHAITEEQELVMIKNVYNTLKRGGKFFIEVRSIHDDIYGQGEKVGRNSYIFNGHFRRFIVIEELLEHLKEGGFKIEYSEESTGFAPFADSDPMIIRVVAIK